MRVLGYDVDPMSGAVTTYGAQDGRFVIKQERDVGPALTYTQALRNAPEYARQGIKNNLQHCVHIPDVVAAKMLTEDGFDVYRRSAREIRLFLRANRAKYAHLFVTTGAV